MHPPTSLATTSRHATAVVAGAAMALAPASYILAQILLLQATPSAAEWAIAHNLLFAWGFFIVLAVFGLGWYLWQPGPIYALVGGVLVIFGALVDTLFTGIDFVSGVMAGIPDRAAMTRLDDAIFAQLVMPLDSLDDALPLGMLVIAIGLYRTRAVSLWPASILLLAIAIPGSDTLKLVTGLLQLLALTWLGWQLATYGGAVAPQPHRAWRPRLAAAILTLVYLPSAPLTIVRAIMLVVVVLLFTVPELQAHPGTRRSLAPASQPD